MLDIPRCSTDGLWTSIFQKMKDNFRNTQKGDHPSALDPLMKTFLKGG